MKWDAMRVWVLSPATSQRFDLSDEESINGPFKIPHMGWNQIEHDETHPLLEDVPSGSHTYFVHSYYCVPSNEEDTVALTQYGRPFTSIVSRENIHGIQFHPEKSQKRGLQLIKNYLEMR